MGPHWTLSIIDGPDKGRQFELTPDRPLVVGRGSDSDTRIRDPKISRVHCEIRHDDGHWCLIDRGGSGGIRLDGRSVVGNTKLDGGSEVCMGDTRLRLEQSSPLDAATAMGLASADTRRPAASKPPPLKDLLGQTLHRFRVDAFVASGRSSVIFKAYDTRRDRVVALKVLKPAMATTETQRDRFIRAMRTVLPIRHPNVVRLYKAGRQGPYCWAAMEWVDGIRVREVIEQIGVSGMLDWKEAWRVAVHIARALQEANKHQITHRNVTPSNVLRRQHGMDYLLTDLVFAKALDQTDAAQLTRPGDIVGELSYIAPERILDATIQEERSDQYSLGATLYALLTGRPPYDAIGIVDLIDKLRGEPPKPPVEFQMGLDERFSDVVMKLLQKTPDQRYLSASDLLRQLGRVGQLGGIEADWAPMALSHLAIRPDEDVAVRCSEVIMRCEH
ncbi:MAG: FHA domain-containing serine/threonine-protein kinase [Planctomycetota bacterium]